MIRCPVCSESPVDVAARSGGYASFTTRIAAAPRLHDNDNPLWQGPCGAGWNGGITQSMLVRFLSCRERFRLKYILGLEPSDKWNKSVGYGNMWHTCEQAHAANAGAAGIVQALHKHTAEQLRRYPLQGDEITKWHHVCCVQFPEYVKYWQEHPDVLNRTPLFQEQVFDVPYMLPSGRVVRLRGKWDSVDLISDAATGFCPALYIQENKTKGDIDKEQVERQLRFDLQTMLYTVALEVETRADREKLHIGGVRYNVVRRPLSGGKGSISPHKAKSTKNKFTPAETEDEFYERLRRDYLAAEPDYWFFRVRTEINGKDIEVFRKTCLNPILEQLACWYDIVTGKPTPVPSWAQNYRTPFGVYSSLEENGATEYDHYLATGSEATLRRVQGLFTELKEEEYHAE